MLLAAEPKTVRVEATVIFEGDAVAKRLWLQVNDVPVGFTRQVQEPIWAAPRGRTAVFLVPPPSLQDGQNHLVLRNEGESLIVMGVELHVKPSHPSASNYLRCSCPIDSQ